MLYKEMTISELKKNIAQLDRDINDAIGKNMPLAYNALISAQKIAIEELGKKVK